MIAATTIPRKRFSLRKHFRDIIIPHKITISTYLFSFLLGTILTFPIFLCHLKIGIIKESSVKPLSKSRDYLISILPMKISFHIQTVIFYSYISSHLYFLKYSTISFLGFFTSYINGFAQKCFNS